MSEERRDYGILVTYTMREEAEVAAAALRAEGIDAFVAPGFHATYDWHLVQALGGLKVFVPWQKLEEARDIIRGRIREAADAPAADAEDAPVARRDRYKVWLVIAGYFGLVGYSMWLSSVPPPDYVYAPPREQELLVDIYFAAPDHLSDSEALAVLRDYCLDKPRHTVIARENGIGYLTPCSDILQIE